MIKYHKQAEKYILSQSRKTALRIYEAIDQLPLGDVKPLRGRVKPHLYRLRVGAFRIVFHVLNDTIFILRIDTRGDIYKMY